MNNENEQPKTAPVGTVEPVVMLKCMRCGIDVHPDKVMNLMTIGPKGNSWRKLCKTCFAIVNKEA